MSDNKKPEAEKASQPTVTKTAAEWQQQLTPEQYRVCREKGTEAPFSGELLNNTGIGTYGCVCCKAPLFRSDAKFESGCGWPSYWKALSDDAVIYQDDMSLGMNRTEILCANCGSHLGHVFPDGPQPTGLRYCVNSVSLTFDDQN